MMPHPHLRRLAVVAALLVLAGGAEPEIGPEDASFHTNPGFEDKCIESFPSLSCDVKCMRLGKVPYCHDETEKCLCREKDAQVEPTEAESKLPSITNVPYQSGTAISDGKVVKIEDYCAFGKIPSTQCKEKCMENDLEPYCGALSKTCLCKKPGSIAPTAPAQDTYCWFGMWPSMDCHHRCGDAGGAYCVANSETNECRCKDEAPTTDLIEVPQTQDEGTETDSETQSESPLHHFLIYINLGGLLGQGEGPGEQGEGEEKDARQSAYSGEAQPTPAKPEVKVPTTAKPEVKLAHAGKVESVGITRDQLFSLQSAAAFAIILILFFLLSIELYSIYSRRRSEKGMANLFYTLPVTTKS